MSESKLFKYLVIVLFVAITGASCSKSPDTPAASIAEGGLLQYVPADTPYLAASLVPLPDDVLDKMEPRIDVMVRAYTSVMRAVVKEKIDASHTLEDAMSDDVLAKIEAIGDEIETLMTIDGMRAAGIGRTSTAVLYGDGLLPVLRLRLTDGKLMEQAIVRVEEKAGSKMAVGKIGDQTYRYAGDAEVQLILALVGDDLVLTVVPANHSDELLKSVLGLVLPAKSMADTGEIGDIAAEHGFQSQFLMLLDTQRIVSTFLDDPDGTNKELLALANYDTATTSDVCQAEIREMAGIMPRMLGGYTEISTERFASNFIIELRPDIAASLTKLVAPVRGLGTTEGGFLSFGMSLDLLAVREFYAEILDRMEAEPYECELFAELQSAVEQGRQLLNQPVPPFVYGFKGFLAVVDSIEGLDLANLQQPTAIEASFLLAMDNAQALLAMGAMFSPELAALDLQADGKPVKLVLPNMNPAVSEAYVVLNDKGLAVSVGSDAAAKLTDLLAADLAEPVPFMSMNMDSGRYYSFLAEAMQLAEADAENDSPEVVAAVSSLMGSMGNWFGRMSFSVNFTERGVEMPSSMELTEDD